MSVFSITSIIRDSSASQELQPSSSATAIFSIRLPDETGKMHIQHYVYKPGKQLIPISHENIQEQFENGTLGYVEKDDPIIPGINR